MNDSNIAQMENNKDRTDSIKTHRKQAFFQIWLPLLLFILLMIFLLVMVIINSSSQALGFDHSLKWANISIMFLSIIYAVGGLIILAILAGLVFLITKALQYLPIYSKLGQKYLFDASTFIITWANNISKPVISLRGWMAGCQSLISALDIKKSINRYKS